MVSVPVRVAPALASKVKVARPLPLPWELVCSQGALLVAVQAPPLTTMSASPPADGPSSRALAPSEDGGRRPSSPSTESGRDRAGRSWTGRQRLDRERTSSLSRDHGTGEIMMGLQGRTCDAVGRVSGTITALTRSAA